MNDTIFACGGFHGESGGSRNSCEQFTVTDSSTGDGRWSLVPALLPYTVCCLSMAVAGGKLYLFGGFDGKFHTGTLATAMVRMMQWRQGANSH